MSRNATRFGISLAGLASVGAAESAGGAPDPVLSLCLAVGVAALFGSPSRAGRARGAVCGAFAAAATTWALEGFVPAIALAAALGALVAFAAPAQGPRPPASWDPGVGGSAVARW